MKVVCIVPSAGIGVRFNSRQDKPFVRLGKKPVLAHTLRVLDRSRFIDGVIVVVLRNKLEKCRRLIKKYNFKKVQGVVIGGKRRFDSVRNGISAIREADFVMVHDGVRPFIEEYLIKRVILAAKRYGAALCAVPTKPTLKLVNRDFLVAKTPDRKSFWDAQTPQAFRNDLIMEAYRRSKNRDATDDAALIERLGHRVKIVRGSDRNIKITTPEDLALARVLLNRRSTYVGRGT
ncbi:MAG: 2-C-methyl-D-erythritol 4-phosphate cytidylyltransferase [Omnitrophica bacterium RBG_13_46_9]|nr:MAG: 2-C-methyl-D-erythritol 4-phosphate cytidylyltransferase [Omnitrophica bacterium RBG_13_46_9]